MKQFGVTIEADGYVYFEYGEDPDPCTWSTYHTSCSGTVELCVYADTEERAKELAFAEAFKKFEFDLEKQDMRCTYCEEIDEVEHEEGVAVEEYWDDVERMVENCMADEDEDEYEG